MKDIERTCDACGHSSDWHRLDDALGLDPTDPATPFRCLGIWFEGCDVACGNFTHVEVSA